MMIFFSIAFGAAILCGPFALVAIACEERPCPEEPEQDSPQPSDPWDWDRFAKLRPFNAIA